MPAPSVTSMLHYPMLRMYTPFTLICLIPAIIWGQNKPPTTTTKITTTKGTARVEDSTTPVPQAYDNYSRNEKVDNLGFVIPYKEIEIGRKLESLRLGFNIAVQQDKDLFKPAIDKIITSIKLNYNKALLDSSNAKSKTLRKMLVNLDKKMTMIKHNLRNIDAFKNPALKIKLDMACMVSVPELTSTVINDRLEEAQYYVDAIESNNAAELLTNEKLYSDNHYYFTNADALISRILDATNGNLVLLENLNSHLIPEKVPLLAQSQGCYNVDNLEELDVEYCTKHSAGLACVIHARAQSQTEKITLYTPVLYNNIALVTPGTGTVLGKTMDGHWCILDCNYDKFEIHDLAEYATCTKTLYQNKCTEGLDSNNVQDIIKNCNFTHTTGKDVIDTIWGILVQNKVSSIRELEPETRIVVATIPTKTPVFITSNAILEISGEQHDYVIKPAKISENRFLNYSYLSQENIKALSYQTTLNTSISKITMGDYIDLLMGIFLLVILPSIMYTYRVMLQTGRGACVNIPKPAKKRQTRANYKANKILLEL